MSETIERAEALDTAREEARRVVYTAFTRHGARNSTSAADRMAAATEAVELLEPYIRARISAETVASRNYAESVARRANDYSNQIAQLCAELHSARASIDTLRIQRDGAWASEDKALDALRDAHDRIRYLERPWWLRWLG